MLKTEIQATELRDADVQFVSLVKRPANRMPFRMTKSEGSGMIDLSRIFKWERPQPTVSAILVGKSADLEAAKTRIVAAGFTISDSFEQDSAVIFPQNGVKSPLEGAVLVKFDENVAVACVNVNKEFVPMNMESADFKEMMATEGFWPSVCAASEILEYSIGNAMRKSGTRGDAAAAVGTLIDDFKGYVTGIISAIPAMAFKMENGKPAIPQSADGPSQNAGSETPTATVDSVTGVTSGVSKEEGDASVTDTGPDNVGAEAKDGQSAEASAEKAVEADVAVTDPVETEKSAAPVAETIDLSIMTKQFETLLATALSGVSEQIAVMTSKFDERIADLDSKVIEAISLAKSAEDKAGSVVISTEEVVNGSGRKSSRVKAEEIDAFMHIDTAYGRPSA